MNFMRWVYFLLGVLILASCGISPKKEENIEHLVKKETMIQVFYDLSLTEAAWRARLHADTLAKEKASQRILSAMEKHGITYEDFNLTHEYYLRHPDELRDMYNEVLARYSTKISEIEEEVK